MTAEAWYLLAAVLVALGLHDARVSLRYALEEGLTIREGLRRREVWAPVAFSVLGASGMVAAALWVIP